MSKTNRVVVASSILIGVTVIALAVISFLPDDNLQVKPPSAKPGASAGDGPSGAADAEYVVIGGVRRKASDVKPVFPVSRNEYFGPRLNIGVNQPVPSDANKNVASVAESLRDKSHPERLSPLIRPTAFDQNAFEQDPQAYLDIVEPGRVFQTAQPGPNVEVLRQQSPRFSSIKQGGSTKLRVKAIPNAPVTFHSFDLGRFAENQLTTVTVQADGEGVAEVEFVGSPGTYNSVDILAGSPLTTGQVKFVVYVEASVTQR